MTMRAIIIDDEYKGITTLKTIIEAYVPDVTIVADTTIASEALNMVRDYRPEIVFLDINMPEMSGFELLEKMSWKNFNLVFTTAHQEYALKALKNNAVDYILKPIDHEEVLAAVGRIRQRIQNKEGSLSLTSYTKVLNEFNHHQKNKILVSLKSGIEAVDISEIVYLESDSNYTQIYLDGAKVILTSRTLKEFDDQLCMTGLNFMRVHHSFIINLNKAVKYLKSEDLIILENAQKIPLSKSKREAFYAWMNI